MSFSCYSCSFLLSLICSPQIVQHLPYGEKADVWAAGCLLYQMATLRPPFYSSNLLHLATKVGPCVYSIYARIRSLSKTVN